MRVLQEGTFERVGEERTRSVSARIVAATNRDLEAEAGAGTFRQDLYFRLATFPIAVPPLRERTEDLPALVTHLVASAASRLGMRPPEVGADALETIRAHDWPGNVRELGHVVERALILGEGRSFALSLGPKSPARPTPLAPLAPTHRVYTQEEMRALDEQNVARALERAGDRIYGPDGAAALLGIPPSTLMSRMRAAEVRKRKPEHD